jgi:serine/threonine protein phosphatase PrpC
MQLDLASHTNVGGRDENEDSILTHQQEDFILLAVADGLGGHGGGKIASSCAVETLSTQKARLESLDETALREVCAEINEEILAGQTPRVRMKTTLALALIKKNALAFLHVGDSRIYLFRQGSIAYQSQDHSVSQLAVLTGAIKQEQIRFHEDRNKVLRSLGSETGATPDIRLEQRPLQPGDAILLCTDGFWEYVTEKEMISLLKQAKTAEDWLKHMHRLIQRRAKKDHDNNSAIALLAPRPEKKPLWRKKEDGKPEK